MGNNSMLTIQGLTSSDITIDITESNNYSITLTELPADVINITFVDGENIYTATLTEIDLQANSGRLVADMSTNVPEPTTATLALLALAGLAARRRRR